MGDVLREKALKYFHTILFKLHENKLAYVSFLFAGEVLLRKCDHTRPGLDEVHEPGKFFADP